MRAYIETPCALLPNALWKTLARLDGMDTSFTVSEGRVESIQMWAPGELHLYWHRRWRLLDLPPERTRGLLFALLHQACAESLPLPHLTRRRAYFRPRHDLECVPPPMLPAGYRFQEVDLPRQTDEVARLISTCYKDRKLAPETVLSWTAHPSYAPELWVWALGPDGRPAGLGIAELDWSVPEGSLEWIQVLPTHRRRGLGAAVVHELLRRLQGQAAFATVAGQVADPMRPERLYRRCGLTGQDVWWVLRAVTGE